MKSLLNIVILMSALSGLSLASEAGTGDIGSVGDPTVAPASRVESFVVCGHVPGTVSKNGEDFEIWEKADVTLNLNNRTLSYDRYIGVIGQPEKKMYRELSFFERFQLNDFISRDSGTFSNLKELPVENIKAIIGDYIKPENVEKIYEGKSFWTEKSGILIKLKNGEKIFSTGMVYSTYVEHCQQFKK